MAAETDWGFGVDQGAYTGREKTRRRINCLDRRSGRLEPGRCLACRHDQARKRGEPHKEAGQTRMAPVVIQVRNEPRDKYEIGSALAANLIRYVDLAGFCIARLGFTTLPSKLFAEFCRLSSLALLTISLA